METESAGNPHQARDAPREPYLGHHRDVALPVVRFDQPTAVPTRLAGSTCIPKED